MAQTLISQTMTDAQRDAMLADLAAFTTKWAPYMVNLTPTKSPGWPSSAHALIPARHPPHTA